MPFSASASQLSRDDDGGEKVQESEVSRFFKTYFTAKFFWFPLRWNVGQVKFCSHQSRTEPKITDSYSTADPKI